MCSTLAHYEIKSQKDSHLDLMLLCSGDNSQRGRLCKNPSLAHLTEQKEVKYNNILRSSNVLNTLLEHTSFCI